MIRPGSCVARAPVRRRDWLLAHAQSLAERDVSDIAPFIKPGQMRLLMDHLALCAGQLLNMTTLGARVGADPKTIDRWIALLERLFIVSRIRPWHDNSLKRLIKTPKLHFIDSGLLAALRDQDGDLSRAIVRASGRRWSALYTANCARRQRLLPIG